MIERAACTLTAPARIAPGHAATVDFAIVAEPPEDGAAGPGLDLVVAVQAGEFAVSAPAGEPPNHARVRLATGSEARGTFRLAPKPARDRSGSARITLHVFNGGVPIGCVSVASAIRAGNGTAPQVQETVELRFGPAVPPPDLTLFALDRPGSAGVVDLAVAVTRPDRPFAFRDLGSLDLIRERGPGLTGALGRARERAGAVERRVGGTVADFVRRILGAIHATSDIVEADKARREWAIADEGGKLWRRLPKACQDHYQRTIAGDLAFGSLLVCSEDWRWPWELVQPPQSLPARFRPGGAKPPMLGARLAVGRWPPNRPLPGSLAVGAAGVAVVLGDDPARLPAGSRKELRVLTERFGAGAPRPGLGSAGFVALLGGGTLDLAHVLTHGGPNQEINLALGADAGAANGHADPDATILRPADLARHKVDFRASARSPLVFLNVCEGGAVGPDAAAAGGGWGEAWVGAGCGAFVAPYWMVNASIAHDVVTRFYADLAAGATIADALRGIRIAFAENRHLHPTWLAYALVGHPAATVALP